MPQLDLMAFFTQFFWFSVFFSFFYIFFLHFIMSSISLNLKFRKKRLNILAEDINKKKEGSFSLLSSYDDILSKTLNFSRLHVGKIITMGNLWLSQTSFNINRTNFSDPNSMYLKILGIKSLNSVILESNFKTLTFKKDNRILKSNNKDKIKTAR